MLQSLAEVGDVDVVHTSDGKSVHRRCASEEHHYLVCRGCGKAVEVGGPAVERWADAMAAEHGFVDVDHAVEISGACAAAG